ncbi:MAG: biosynthetic-type acetolactate synthase large subunit [Sinobacteraceae bacterium]|nr:biosynthetic-type acetolactate synthase large subunit [Nevskiaceae bacterium]MCP5359503.1 biosynthetic-type acetolactate synthase large subunit [Nevskiaceae bacterium]MCP5466846.1 biosynthetic-type acetolactate synthase large subunit [Nevskiaceae bacterium]MCP5470935.1 biosynthetic-type acetolactate synthase large subunit [Nevskiaceae bacterium]
MTGAQMIVQVLADEGTTAIFGYSGGAILPTYDAVFLYNQAQGESGDRPMPLIVPANEQGAGFMAAGYARASGRVGVCLVTSGPGATNTVTPVRDCMADSVPMIVICGQVPTGMIGTDAFQEAPVAALMGSVAKHVFLVTDPQQLEATVRTAFEIARTGRPGPVVIDVPKDVQNWSGTFKGDGVLPIPGYRKRLFAATHAAVEDDEAAAFFDMLCEARRPLIYAGGGVVNSGAATALTEFASEFGIPVVTTLMGIGAIDTTHRLAMRMLGMHGTAFANYAVEDCDFLLAVGARFDDRVAGVPEKFAKNARRIAHIDIDRAEINKVKRVQWNHVGQIGDALKTLLAFGRREGFRPDLSAWHAELDELRRTYAMNYDRASEAIQPYYVIEEINRLTRGEAIIATGVGQHQMWAAQYCDFKRPRLWLTSGSMGTMGFGLPAAIGAQVANPDALVIDIDGDASIRMNVGELETVTTYNLPVKVVVLNNYGDGMVKQWQKLFFKGRLSASDKSLHKKDFVKAAQADGFPYAVRLLDKADVPRVVEEFIRFPGPAFLEVIIDRDAGVYPMVGPGQAYDDMITGEFIASRNRGSEPKTPGPSEMF